MKGFKSFNVLVKIIDINNISYEKLMGCVIRNKKDITPSLLMLNDPNIKTLEIISIKEV